jgi:hypothetical protein
MFNLCCVLIVALLSIVYVSSYQTNIAFHKYNIKKNMYVKKSMKLNSYSWLNTITIAAAEITEKPDDYVYGAVSAPSWVLPVASVFIILSAAVPFLLKPGEDALEQQRKDEETKGKPFGGKKSDV